MYTLQDGGGRSLTLRPEVTAPIVRSYLEHGMHTLPQPVKLWYLGPCFRYERAQAGRYRQFWQIGAEAIGSDDPAVDAESILLLAALLEELGVRGLRLRLASLGTPASRAAYRELLQAHLRAQRGPARRARCAARIDLNPLRAFDSDHPGTRAVMATAPLLMDHLDADDVEHFAAVRAMLDAVELPYEIDGSLVRGLDYYTRTVFEFTSDALGAQSGVGGGGRYDGLAEQLGGAHTPGMGWAAGVERMLLAAEERPVPEPVCDLFIAMAGDLAVQRAAAIALAAEARRAGVPTQVELAGPLAEGTVQAGRAPAGPLRCRARRRGNRAEGHGERRAGIGREQLGGRRARAARKARGMKAPQPNRYRDSWCGSLTAERTGSRSRASPAGCTAAATTAA